MKKFLLLLLILSSPAWAMKSGQIQAQGPFTTVNLTTSQKNSIISPQAGMIVYDTTLGALQIYSGSSWTSVGSGSGAWGTITGTLSSQTDLQSALNGKQLTLGLTPGTFINGDVCTYSSGGIFNCASAPSGTGTVTTVSVVSANGISGSVANATLTPAITIVPFLNSSGINWQNVELFMTIGKSINWQAIPQGAQMYNINWNDAKNLNQTVNWYSVPLITNTIQTTSSGVGIVQLWNAAKSFFFNQSVNSGLSASYGINWPATPPISGQFPQFVDNLGNLGWISTVGVNWNGLLGNPNLINWQSFPNTFAAGHGVNWDDIYYATTKAVNWPMTMSTPQITVNGSGSAIVNVGTCTSHTGHMSCIGTSVCVGYVSAFTDYQTLTCNCC